jgi:polyphosphate kinase 2 (PPK2 family)
MYWFVRFIRNIVLNEGIAGIESVKDINAAFWKGRYESIRSFEKHISRNGTVILKFFLNVSKEEQKKRFLERIDEPSEELEIFIRQISMSVKSGISI